MNYCSIRDLKLETAVVDVYMKFHCDESVGTQHHFSCSRVCCHCCESSVLLQATVLEEMPPFPLDKESSLLNKLYETAPWTAKLHKKEEEGPSEDSGTAEEVLTVPPIAVISEPNISKERKGSSCVMYPVGGEVLFDVL